jgi:hypothetical protein
MKPLYRKGESLADIPDPVLHPVAKALVRSPPSQPRRWSDFGPLWNEVAANDVGRLMLWSVEKVPYNPEMKKTDF